MKWYEIDHQDVIATKKRLLRAQGAALSSKRNPVVSPRKPKFPLRVSAWIPLVADVAEPRWRETLVEAGFDPSQPTVWVAEGITMCAWWSCSFHY